MIIRRNSGVGTTFLVLMALAMGLILAVASFHATSSNARQQHIQGLGTEASMGAQNLVDEGFYSVFVRLNSPRTSAKYTPDLYVAVRELAVGQTLAFEIPPQLASRTMPSDRFKVEPVRARLTFDSMTSTVTTSGPATIASALYAPGASPTSPVPGAPAGASSLECYTIPQLPPVTVEQQLGKGRLELEAKVEAAGGDGITVGRETRVTFPFTITRVAVAGQPSTALVTLIPIQEGQETRRWETREKK